MIQVNEMKNDDKYRLKQLNVVDNVIKDLEYLHNNIINSVKHDGEINGAEYYYYAEFDKFVMDWMYKFKRDRRLMVAMNNEPAKDHRNLVKV